ncbi:hypothetical protein [Actinosynnema sp. NPDC020468]|uniref:hypothetical protein n=1 Tax=Actinosynnema sp. NPDC020468 TaxID=3154488 RepID=UPI0033DA8352
MRRPWLPAVFVLVLGGCSVESGPVPIATPVPVRKVDTTSTTPAPAHLAAQPMAGKAGFPVDISGDGFPPGRPVVITFNGQKVGEASADLAGAFTAVSVTVPASYGDSAPGTQYFIRGTSGPQYAEAPFVLTR